MILIKHQTPINCCWVIFYLAHKLGCIYVLSWIVILIINFREFGIIFLVMGGKVSSNLRRIATFLKRYIMIFYSFQSVTVAQLSIILELSPLTHYWPISFMDDSRRHSKISCKVNFWFLSGGTIILEHIENKNVRQSAPSIRGNWER